MTITINKILLIDDEEAIIFGFKKVLSGPTIKVDAASTVEDAKNRIEKNTYSAAIVDLRLTNSMTMEGIVLVALIKNVQANCRVIVLTAYGDDDAKRRAIEAGADLFLEKPVTPHIIKRKLEDMGIY